jgi:AraC-like DNA-binding protein
MIDVRTLAPSSPMAGVIERHVVYSGRGSAREFERVFPTGQPELTLNLRTGELRCYDVATFAAHRERGALVSGVHMTPYIIDTAQLEDMISVRLHPTGLWRLFGIPADTMTGAHVLLSDVLGSEWNRLAERLHDAVTAEERVKRMEAALRLLPVRASHPAVANAVARICASPAHVKVLELAREHGLSFRRFNLLFRREVGLSPKQFTRVRRFQTVRQTLARNPHIEGSHLATTHGYADQAHMIREYREFTGFTPSQHALLQSGMT